jgi:hypothetical protein
MATKKGNTGFYLLLGALVLGAGAAAYFLYFKPKKDKKKQEEEQKQLEEQNKNEPSPQPQTPSQPSLMEPPFKNEGQGNAFRAWVNKFYPAYAKSIDLDPVGKTTTTAIKTAWTKYGNEYIKNNPNWEKYTSGLGSTGIPAALEPFVERNVVKTSDIKQTPNADKGGFYISINRKTPKGTDYTAEFYANGGFNVKSGGKSWYYGGFSDGGRNLKVLSNKYKDIYKFTLPTTDIKKGGLFDALDALFPAK